MARIARMIRWIREIDFPLRAVELNLRVRYSNREFAYQPVAGIGEGEVLVVHDQADDIAALATDEALKDVLFIVDMHRWMLVVVIPALGTLSELSHAIEADAEL